MSRASPATQSNIHGYWSRVAALGCVVHGPDCPAEICHAHGPSVTEKMQEPKAKGKKLKRYQWLVLGICPFLHRIAPDSLDLNPREFERKYGTVAHHIDSIALQLGVDVWALAKAGKK